MTRGQLTILGIFGLALVSAVLAILWRHNQTRRTLQFLGPTASRLIVSAQKVELLRLERTGDQGEHESPGEESFVVDGIRYRTVQTKDVSDAPGFLNARHALIMDRSYQWQDDGTRQQPEWQTALRFSDAQDEETMLFCFQSKTMRRLNAAGLVGIPRIAASLQMVMDEQLNDVSRDDTNSSTENQTVKGVNRSE